MEYEELHSIIGECGVYQVCTVIASMLVYMFSLDSITMIFVGAEMPHWCRIEQLTHLPFDQQKYIGIPHTDETPGQGDEQGQLMYSSCQMFAMNYSAFSDDELNDWNRTTMINDSTPVIDCRQWVYEQTTFVSTIVSRVSCLLTFITISVQCS
jgi:hypothetical protein